MGDDTNTPGSTRICARCDRSTDEPHAVTVEGASGPGWVGYLCPACHSRRSATLADPLAVAAAMRQAREGGTAR
ncbi:hypothetical protein [Streptomyces buecherae]|uniref:hypothetical protein n=1 Tax=Streptomyces buecherae TaxID=2763006 RepID=UPI001C272A16|nr:hypothetical protein [Streptomyces buecherae]